MKTHVEPPRTFMAQDWGMFRSCILVLALATFPSIGPAAIYTEVGDFSNTVGGAPVFAMDLGLNTISGVLEGGGADVFRFELPAGGEFLSRELTAFEFGLSPAQPSWLWAICDGEGLCFGTVVTPTTPLPLDLGTSGDAILFSVNNEVTCIAGCAYTIELQVGRSEAEVPEPSTCILSGSALALLFFRRRRPLG